MKRLKNFMFLLILIPICFSFISCKKASDDDNGEETSPSTPEIPTESFSVAYDYNLPEKYDFLLTDFTDSNNKLGSSVNVATISDENLSPYFLGWYDSSDNEVTGSVTSSTVTTINLKGKWNEESIEKYYYTTGLTFSIDNNNATVSNFAGSTNNIVIPNVYVYNSVEYAVNAIGDSVFEGLSIQNLIINANSISVGKSTFKNSSIHEFDFSIVTKIGDSAFENTKVPTIVFSSNLTHIGNSVFNGCKELTAVNFSNLEIDIPLQMFNDCEKLATIENAKNILSIGQNSFAGCIALKDTNFLSECTKIESIGKNAFLNCVNIESAVIPESVITISVPFEGCSKLNSLKLSRTYATEFNGSDNIVKHVGNIASSLKIIELEGNSTSRILMNYFSNLTELETFVMSNSVRYIEMNAFSNCKKLKNITLSENIVLEDFTYYAFSNTKYLDDMTEPLIYKNSIIYVPQTLVSEYSIPSGVTKINDYAFSSRNTLVKITIPASVEDIGESAFSNCNNLKEVFFEENNSLTTIKQLTFAFCRNLDTINLTNLKALSKINTESFKYTAFTKFVIPSTVSDIGKGVFINMPVTEFEISGSGGKFLVKDDGVLYKDISESGTGDELKLMAYPKCKEGRLFVVPNEVKEIAVFAFVGIERNANMLRYVYFKNDDIEFEELRSSTYNTFEDSLVVLKEKENFEIPEVGISVCQKLDSGCGWDFETNTVVFDVNFSEGSGYYFIKFFDDPKFSLAIFEYKSDGDNSGIVDGSLVVLEKIFDN